MSAETHVVYGWSVRIWYTDRKRGMFTAFGQNPTGRAFFKTRREARAYCHEASYQAVPVRARLVIIVEDPT